MESVVLMSKSGAETEKDMESERLVPTAQQAAGAAPQAKRRMPRPMLWLGNLSALPYQIVRTVVWPSSRKTSETFTDDHTFLFDLKHVAATGFRFDQDKLWGALRKTPGILLWTAVASTFILPHLAPTMLAYLTLMCLLQNVTVMLFATLNTFRGFHAIAHAISHPPPHPSRMVVDGASAASAGAGGSGVAAQPASSAGGGGASSSSSAAATPAHHHLSAVHPADVLHLISICRCTEPVDVLEETLGNLASHSNRESYVILLALESKDDKAAAVGELLTRKWGRSFARVMYAVHPGGLDGEVPGKSSNTNWAVQTAAAALERDATFGPRCCDRTVVTVCDIDARISEMYFNALSAKFAAALREGRPVFFAPPSLFDEGLADAAAEARTGGMSARDGGVGGGLESPGGGGSLTPGGSLIRSNSGRLLLKSVGGGAIPAPVRIADQMWSMFLLQNLASANWVKMPCSTYSVGLRLIASVGWWDVGVESVPEDYHTALKLYWGTSGRCRCEPIYYPVVYQHIDGGSWLGGVHQRFQQGLRHMWGATDVAYVLWLFRKLTHVPLPERLAMTFTVLDVHLSAAVIAFMGSFAFPILLLLRPDWAGSDEGRIALQLQKVLTGGLMLFTFLTATCYEWYAPDVLRETLRSGPPTSSLTTSASHLSLSPAVTPRKGMPSAAASASAAGAPVSGAAAVFDGGASAPHAPPSGAVGPAASATAGSAGAAPDAADSAAAQQRVSWAFAYVARLSAWAWAPVIAVLYLLLPAAFAQTKLMFTDRLKLHVSPKSSPVTPSPLASSPSVGSMALAAAGSGSGGGPAAAASAVGGGAAPGASSGGGGGGGALLAGAMPPPAGAGPHGGGSSAGSGVAVSLVTGDVTSCMDVEAGEGGGGGGGGVSGGAAGSGGSSASAGAAAGSSSAGSRRASVAAAAGTGLGGGGGGSSSGSSGSSGAPQGRLGGSIGVGHGVLKAHAALHGGGDVTAL